MGSWAGYGEGLGYIFTLGGGGRRGHGAEIGRHGHRRRGITFDDGLGSGFEELLEDVAAASARRDMDGEPAHFVPYLHFSCDERREEFERLAFKNLLELRSRGSGVDISTLSPPRVTRTLADLWAL